MEDEAPPGRLDGDGWPGFTPEDIRAGETQLSDERGEVQVDAPASPRAARGTRSAPMLVILALLALLGLAGARLIVGSDSSSGSAAPQQGPPVAAGGGNGSQPPPTSGQTGTVSPTTTDSATTTTDDTTRSTDSSSVRVPDVVGEPASDATRRLRAADLHPETHLVSSSRAAGTVVDQTPSAGRRLASGGLVTLDVAKPRPVVRVRVPQLVGMTVADAKQAVRSVALSSSVTTVSSPKTAGAVLGQSPAPGAKVRRGSVVALRVSTGPALVTVTDVTGLDEVDARAMLENDGFQVVVVDRPTDDSTQDGVVVDQSPSGSTDARQGSTVTITVARISSGP